MPFMRYKLFLPFSGLVGFYSGEYNANFYHDDTYGVKLNSEIVIRKNDSDFRLVRCSEVRDSKDYPPFSCHVTH